MRPPDLPPIDRWPHGVRSRYVSGCRCEECRRANREYQHRRALAQIRGDWNGLVDAKPVRRHLRKLSRKGVGYKTVADVAGVGHTALFQILSGRKTKTRARSAKAVLAVTADARADHSLVPARRTWHRLDRLLAEGFTKGDLAQRLGCKKAALHLPQSENIRQARDVIDQTSQTLAEPGRSSLPRADGCR